MYKALAFLLLNTFIAVVHAEERKAGSFQFQDQPLDNLDTCHIQIGDNPRSKPLARPATGTI